MVKIQKRGIPEQRLLKAIFGPNLEKVYKCYKCKKRVHEPIWVGGHIYHSDCLSLERKTQRGEEKMPSASAIKKVEGLNPYQKLLPAVFGTKTKPELPKLGDIAQARDIDRKGNGRYIWTACPRCHKERWVDIYNLECSKYNGLCINCWNQRNRLNGSWIRRSHGYIKLKLQSDNFFYPMADKEGYVLEHRLVMAKHLGRCLHSWEVVRHQNDVRKDDNRIEVLKLMTDETNIQIMVIESKITRLKERNTLLVAESI